MHPTLHVLSRSLLADFVATQRTLSWAIERGGVQRTRQVLWLEVTDQELGPDVPPKDYIRSRCVQLNTMGGNVPSVDFSCCPVMLTSRRVQRWVREEVELDGSHAGCIATVGLSNALRVGEAPAAPLHVGTINFLCWLSASLSENAMLEALSIATEARTLAIMDAGVRSSQSEARATGTGTDCIVLACPDQPPATEYAGKHTNCGYLLGRAVYKAVLRGAEEWLEERGSQLASARKGWARV